MCVCFGGIGLDQKKEVFDLCSTSESIFVLLGPLIVSSLLVFTTTLTNDTSFAFIELDLVLLCIHVPWVPTSREKNKSNTSLFVFFSLEILPHRNNYWYESFCQITQLFMCCVICLHSYKESSYSLILEGIEALVVSLLGILYSLHRNLPSAERSVALQGF